MNQKPSSRLAAAQAEAENSSGPSRNLMILLGGLVVAAIVIALLVTSLGGGDDDVADNTSTPDDASSATDDDGAGVSLGSLAFGGPTIPEVADVAVIGDALPAGADGADPAIGATAPVVQATSLSSGSVIELAPGQPRIIGFFAHWCGHCQAELPELREWLETADLPDNVDFVAVSTAVNADAPNYPPSAWFNAEDWREPVIVDDADATLLNAYGFTGFPSFIAIDAEGVVVDRVTGNLGVEGFERLFDNFT